MLPRDYISYNQIRQYQTCPRKYRYAYIENIKPPVNHRIYLGIVYHSSIEYFLKKKAGGVIIPHEELQQYFNDLFDTRQQEIEVCWDSEKGKNQSRQRGRAFINYFLKEFAGRIQPFLIEKELEVEVADLGIKLKGIPDLVEKDFSITDFKTTTARWPKNRINQALLQMVIYKYLFESQYGKVNNQLKFRIIYSRTHTNIKHQELVIDSRDIDFKKMFDIIEYIIDQISSQRFYRNESFHCRFCEYRDLCLPRT